MIKIYYLSNWIFESFIFNGNISTVVSFAGVEKKIHAEFFFLAENFVSSRFIVLLRFENHFKSIFWLQHSLIMNNKKWTFYKNEGIDNFWNGPYQSIFFVDGQIFYNVCIRGKCG